MKRSSQIVDRRPIGEAAEPSPVDTTKKWQAMQLA